MVTLSLKTLGFLHWRGDRNFEDFAFTFEDLLGADHFPSREGMLNLRAALQAMPPPPNPNRTLADELPAVLPLPGQYQAPAPQGTAVPLPAGNALAGRDIFSTPNNPDSPLRCSGCHPAQTGEGHNVVELSRNHFLPFIPKPLLNLSDKMGLSLEGPESRAGFGFLHDGRIDTLSRFLHKGFGIADPQTQADLIAFLLCFGGADGDLFSGDDFHSGGGVHAATGKQLMATGPASPSGLPELLAVLSPSARWSSRIDLIAWQHQALQDKTWYYDPVSQRFLASEREEDAATPAALLALASASTPIIFMTMEGGRGRKESIDEDGDGVGNLVEIAQGSDPADFYSPVAPPAIPPLFLRQPVDHDSAMGVSVYPGMTLRHALGSSHALTQYYQIGFSLPEPASTPPGSIISADHRFVWAVPADAAVRLWNIPLTVTSSRPPGFTSTGVLRLRVLPPSVQLQRGAPFGTLKYNFLLPRVFHEVETSEDLTTWKRGWRFHSMLEGSGQYEFSFKEIPVFQDETPSRRFYRLKPLSDAN